MKRISVFAIGILLGLVLGAEPASAQGRFGAGFVFGAPTGFAWKYRINQSNAIDGGLGFSPYDQWRLHVDYLWNSYPFREQGLSVFYGIGAAVGFGRTGYFYVARNGAYFYDNRDVGAAARIPVGLGYLIPRSPLEIYMEVAPLLVFAPVGGVDVDAGLGARFYF